MLQPPSSAACDQSKPRRAGESAWHTRLRRVQSHREASHFSPLRGRRGEQVRALRTFLDWEAVKPDMSPGDTVPLTIARDGSSRTVRVRVEDLPTARAEKVDVLGGLRLVTVTPAVRQERGIRSEQGALIYDIPATTQGQTGLRAGDVIRQINQSPVTRAEDVDRLIGATRSLTAVRVFFERDGRAFHRLLRAMTPPVRYESPLGTRYASPAMQALWSAERRAGLWRRLG